jgi:hypothetical protein
VDCSVTVCFIYVAWFCDFHLDHKYKNTDTNTIMQKYLRETEQCSGPVGFFCKQVVCMFWLVSCIGNSQLSGDFPIVCSYYAWSPFYQHALSMNLLTLQRWNIPLISSGPLQLMVSS